MKEGGRGCNRIARVQKGGRGIVTGLLERLKEGEECDGTAGEIKGGRGVLWDCWSY